MTDKLFDKKIVNFLFRSIEYKIEYQTKHVRHYAIFVGLSIGQLCPSILIDL